MKNFLPRSGVGNKLDGTKNLTKCDTDTNTEAQQVG